MPQGYTDETMMYRMIARRFVVSALALVALSFYLSFYARAAAQTAAPSDGSLKADIKRALTARDLGLSSRLTVEVADGVVTLTGTVPTLWSKEEVINRSLKAGRVKSLVVELTIPSAENDQALAEAVVGRIRSYNKYTVYDDIRGAVQNGVVHLVGSVTGPDKAQDLLERVGKVRGVQEIDSKLEVLPASQGDDRLREAIANAIYSSETFENYSIRSDPPIHVIVSNSRVTLVGYIQSQLERIKATSIARGVYGVIAVVDNLELIGGKR